MDNLRRSPRLKNKSNHVKTPLSKNNKSRPRKILSSKKNNVMISSTKHQQQPKTRRTLVKRTRHASTSSLEQQTTAAKKSRKYKSTASTTITTTAATSDQDVILLTPPSPSPPRRMIASDISTINSLSSPSLELFEREIELKSALRHETLKFEKACRQLVLLDQHINDLQNSYVNSVENDRRTFKVCYRMQLATLEGTHNAYMVYIERQIEKIKKLKQTLFNEDFSIADMFSRLVPTSLPAPPPPQSNDAALLINARLNIDHPLTVASKKFAKAAKQIAFIKERIQDLQNQLTEYNVRHQEFFVIQRQINELIRAQIAYQLYIHHIGRDLTRIQTELYGAEAVHKAYAAPPPSIPPITTETATLREEDDEPQGNNDQQQESHQPSAEFQQQQQLVATQEQQQYQDFFYNNEPQPAHPLSEFEEQQQQQPVSTNQEQQHQLQHLFFNNYNSSHQQQPQEQQTSSFYQSSPFGFSSPFSDDDLQELVEQEQVDLNFQSVFNFNNFPVATSSIF